MLSKNASSVNSNCATISLCMIVKDEEERLEALLQNFDNVFDEIVIVDTGSKDKTKEIAKKFTKKVFNFKWSDDFSKARNFAIGKCTSDYWMWLDADDHINAEDLNKLKQLKIYLKNEYSEPDFFIFPYHYSKDKDKTTKNLVFRERLFKTKAKAKFRYPIHEIVDTSSLKGIAIKDINIHHLDISSEDRTEKTERNVKLLKKALRSQEYSNDLHLNNHLSLAYLALADYKKALRSYAKCLAICNKEEYGEVEKAKYLAKVALCNEKLKDYPAAIEYALQSAGCDPFVREPFVILAQSFYITKKYNKALFWYQMADSIPMTAQRSSYDATYYNHHVKDAIASIYHLLGDYKKAYEYAQQALNKAPGSDRLKRNVAKLQKILSAK